MKMLFSLYWPQYQRMAHIASALCVTELRVPDPGPSSSSSFQPNSLSIIYPILSQLVDENIMGKTVKTFWRVRKRASTALPSPTYLVTSLQSVTLSKHEFPFVNAC